MKLKRFRAPDMRQAINMVRDQFGPDAVIMSNQTLEDGVEIVAAIDVDGSDAKNTQFEIKAEKEEKLSKFEWHHGTEFNEIKSEINGLKTILDQHFTQAQSEMYALKNPVKASIKLKLDQLNLTQSLQKHLLEKVNYQEYEQAWYNTQSNLVDLIPKLDQDLIQAGGALAMIGPSGAGKTTTIAKLIARSILHFGRDNCALISTDTQRVGSCELLLNFGRLFNIPVLIAENAEQLQSHLETLKQMRSVIIDTPSLNFANTLTMLTSTSIKIKCCLTIPSNLTKAHLDRIVSEFNTRALACVIMTKLDEATTLGETLSLLIENELPIAYVSHGQRIPEDLTACNSQKLVRLALDLHSHTDTAHKGVKNVFQTI